MKNTQINIVTSNQEQTHFLYDSVANRQNMLGFQRLVLKAVKWQEEGGKSRNPFRTGGKIHFTKRIFRGQGRFSNRIYLRGVFLKLRYLIAHVDSVINRFITSRLAVDLNNHHTDDVIQIVIPYKDQDAAVYVKRQLCQFGLKIKIPKNMQKQILQAH